jgi:hypothetical protein
VSPLAIAETLVAQGFRISPTQVFIVQTKLASPISPVPEPQAPPRHIPFEEGKLFYKLYAALCSYANGKLKLVPGDFSEPDQFTSLPPETRVTVRDAVFAQPELIDQFVQENPSQLTAAELTIVAGWKHAVIGTFCVFRYLQPHAVFLKTEAPVKAYGVLALANSFEEVVGPYLPVMVKCVLLPINGRIIYDGLMARYNVSFGAGIRRSMNEDYKQAKETYGIITSLPESSRPSVVKKAPTKQPAASGGTADVKAVLEAIEGMTDAFCRDYLNDGYAVLCRNLTAALARKRPSPLLRGSPRGLGCRHRANDRLGQLSPRSQSDPAHEAPVHRRSVRHRGKHGDLQVESDSNNVQDLSVRPEVDPTEQAAGQSDVLNNPDRITDWGKLDWPVGASPAKCV